MAIHRFKPTHYFNTLGSHEPVLSIAVGDTVITTTVDAGGKDASNKQVTAGGNPQTGPFYVEGAQPGDRLVVTLDKLTPNRSYGYSGKVLAANVVDPEYVTQLPWPAKKQPRWAEWSVNAKKKTATLLRPETALANLTLPIKPMLGCFGVAPPRGQVISTATSWVHGGNMDYRGFSQGVTVYFPVFMPGALFFLGDGHAVQGDGEIAGSGIEISLDVQFTVSLQKGKPINWPRGENKDYIFSAGNARPLDQCVQHATTEMLNWLQDDYGLDAVGANILMGQCVEYELGNMFDPAYTIICKMPKRVLAALRTD